MIAAIKIAPVSVRPRSLTSQQKRASHVVAAARDSWLPGSDFPKRTCIDDFSRYLSSFHAENRAVTRGFGSKGWGYLPLSGRIVLLALP